MTTSPNMTRLLWVSSLVGGALVASSAVAETKAAAPSVVSLWEVTIKKAQTDVNMRFLSDGTFIAYGQLKDRLLDGEGTYEQKKSKFQGEVFNDGDGKTYTLKGKIKKPRKPTINGYLKERKAGKRLTKIKFKKGKIISNTEPTADAGPDQDGYIDALVSLDGSGSDDSDRWDVIGYSWTFQSRPSGSSATLTGATTVSPSFTPDKDGQYVIQLEVADDVGDTDTDEVVVQVQASRPPVADAGPDQVVPLGQMVQLDGSDSTDPDGDPLTYQWAFLQVPAGSGVTGASLSDPTAVDPTFTPDLGGTYVLELTVSDGSGASDTDDVSIISDTVPTARAGDDFLVATDSLTRLNGSGSIDPTSKGLTYSWTFVSRPPGSSAALSDADTALPTFTPDVDGDYEIQLAVQDGDGDTASDSVVVTATEFAPGRIRLLESLSIGVAGEAFLTASVGETVIVTTIVNAGSHSLGAYSCKPVRFDPTLVTVSPDKADYNGDGDMADEVDTDGDGFVDTHEADVLPDSGGFGFPFVVALPSTPNSTGGHTPDDEIFFSDWNQSGPTGEVKVVRLKFLIDVKPANGRTFVGGAIGAIGSSDSQPIGDFRGQPIIPVAIDVQ